MYFLALATDYDGTLAQHGAVNAETCAVLRRFKETGRRLVLVTGRELVDLKHAFAEVALFDRVVAENGAVIYDPATGRERLVASSPPPLFVERLIERRVEPISVGHSVVATWEPHQSTVLSVIRELGLDLQIIFNKGAVMVLPTGVNKASGLEEALAELRISARNVVAVGDGENDHALLKACGCAAAVANGVPSIIQEADIRLSRDHGAGVTELMQRILEEDLRMMPEWRHGILLGVDVDGTDVYVQPDRTVLIVGPSQIGKSRFATLLAERMLEKKVDFCIFDAEGDYTGFEQTESLGGSSEPPVAEETMLLLRDADVNVVINALPLSRPDRQLLFAEVLPLISGLRAATGRPHWTIVDEAHHFVGASGPLSSLPELAGTILISLRPDLLSRDALEKVDVLLAFGHTAPADLRSFTELLGLAQSEPPPALRAGEILVWDRRSAVPPRAVRIATPRRKHQRHTGKYFIGDLDERQSFYFRGPASATCRRACNLVQFLHEAQHVDDATWEHHLRSHDYSAWFRNVIRDEELARMTAEIECDTRIDPRESRRLLRQFVSERYKDVA